MLSKLPVAAVQMDANPAPCEIRLQAAASLVAQAVTAGAQLVVLPELFNTGYTYADSNFAAAELPDGTSAAWMRQTAARLNVHVAGSLLLQQGDEIVNALLLFAPDGRFWRYEKLYPWGWERAYFRSGRDITIANTDLGDIGLLICWDAAHTRLWRRYAGQVDLMVITSCPPQVSNPTYRFANGETATFDRMGPLFARLKGSDRLVFGEMLNEQTAWLGVPAVNSVGCGRIETRLPNARRSLLAMALLWPPLLKYLRRGELTVMACALTPGCKVVNGDGRVLAQRSQAAGPGFALAEISLASPRLRPTSRQPATRVPWLAYFISDLLLPLLTQSVYHRRGQ
jgi:hypothetical protein